MSEHAKEQIVEIPAEAAVVVHDGAADLEISRPVNEVLSEARKAAMALKDVISKKSSPVTFNGKQYLEFEDWQTLGKFYGVTAKVTGSRILELGGAAGYEAEAEAVHVASGRVISRAESMCMTDEPNWSKKPLFQLRSMAQTRACAKALRNVLAWVVVLAGYAPTPAEEMYDGGGEAGRGKEPGSPDEVPQIGWPATEKQTKMLWAKCCKRTEWVLENSKMPIKPESIYADVLKMLGRKDKSELLKTDVDKAVELIEGYDPTPVDEAPF
jgi:hypothetical protein